MPNLIEVTYSQSGQSTHTDAPGMREMQAKDYAQGCITISFQQ